MLITFAGILFNGDFREEIKGKRGSAKLMVPLLYFGILFVKSVSSKMIWVQAIWSFDHYRIQHLKFYCNWLFDKLYSHGKSYISISNIKGIS